ncbi:serine hydrolase domain-containing protein [Maribacter sp. HTCC2170]|uniref:serine hydrolase domain-containing protein n=1 Tax=Maribacter sp. (strain HTCC2170 / KCCM 42371) TaxID=313603 RepID=UPI00006AE5C3|nr:serine hydrolase domain-containing protein [Maribacter sp. HTCC2170]EAR00559.1 beta-lactamase [Maribacter sp. HTCC2170]
MQIQKTSTTIKFGFLFMLALCSMSCSSDDDAVVVPEEKNLTTTLSKHLDENQSKTNPGLSILIKHNGEVIYQGQKGLARLEGNHEIDQHTGFRIGSITKSVTAIAIMQLVEQDQMSLEDKLLDILPFLPSSFENITIAHLLSHRSGLLDYIDDNNDWSTLDGVTTSQIPSIVPGSGLDNLLFEPGSEGEYSNTGYVFLALIIEQISGMRYPEYLKQNIFEPLGMENSFVIYEEEHLGDLNENYALSLGNSIKVLGFNSLIYGGNGIVSSTYDLNLFVEALLSNRLITKQSLDQMVETQGAIKGIADYGYGWMTGTGDYWHTEELTDRNDFWHAGGFDGYRTVLSINPDLDLQIIILTNNGDKSQKILWELIRLTKEFIKNNQ